MHYSIKLTSRNKIKKKDMSRAMQIIVEMKEKLMAKIVYLGIKAWWHMLQTSYKVLYYPQWIRLFFSSGFTDPNKIPTLNSDSINYCNIYIYIYITFKKLLIRNVNDLPITCGFREARTVVSEEISMIY